MANLKTSGVFNLGALGGDVASNGDANWNDVTLLLDGSSPTTDLSSQNQSSLITNNNSVSTTSLAGPSGHGTVTALDFNGSTQYLTSSHYTASLYNQDFTIEGWYYIDSAATYVQSFFSHRDGNSQDSVIPYIASGSTYGFVVGNGSWVINTTGGTATNGWHHIALTRSGNDYVMWVDGVSTLTGTSSATVSTSGNFAIAVGMSVSSVSQYFKGKVFDFRVTEGVARDIATDWADGVYSGALPQGLPAAGATRPTRRWGGMLGRTLTTDVDAAPVVDHSLRFDGSADYLLTGAVSASNQQTFTTSAWIKLSDNPSADAAILASGTVGAGPNCQVGLTVTANNDLFWFQYNAGWDAQYQTQNTLNVGSWYHVVCQVDTTATTKCKIWIDGTLQTLQTVTYDYGDDSNTLMSVGTWPSTSYAQKFTVGGMYSAGNSTLYYPFPGQLAEIHFIDGQALTAADFGETRGGQWVPKEVTGVTYGNNGFYLPFDRKPEGVTLLLDGSSETDVTGLSSIVERGTVTSGNTPSKFSHYTDFDNTTTQDNLKITLPSALGASNEPFTIETWARFDVLGASGNEGVFQLTPSGTTIDGTGASGGVTGATSLAMAVINNQWRIYNEATYIDNLGAVVKDQWYHLALTSDGTTLRWFVDGSQIYSIAIASTSVASGGYPNLVVGCYYTQYYAMNGRIEDFRVTQGIARDIAAGFSSGTPVTGGGWDVSLTNDIQYGSLGRDASTNTNNFAVNGAIKPDDQLLDTPNLRFATWDTASVDVTLSEGNLKTTHGAYDEAIASESSALVGGKFYCELYWATGTNLMPQVRAAAGASAYSGYFNDGKKYGDNNVVPGGSATYGSSYGVGSIIGCAVDATTSKVWWRLNETWQASGDPENGTNPATSSGFTGNPPLFFALSDGGSASTGDTSIANFGQDHTFAGAKSPLASPFTDSDGNGEFYYEPPAGFKALTTKVVGTDTVLPSTGVISLAEHYQTKLPR